MAKFGTGDVLTGIISGFLAQLKDLETSIITGVYLHSLSADLLLKNSLNLVILQQTLWKTFQML